MLQTTPMIASAVATQHQVLAESEARRMEKTDADIEKPALAAVKESPKKVNEEPKPGNKPINQDQKKELQKIKNRFRQLEEQVAALTQNKNRLEASLADPAIYSDKEKFKQAETEYNNANAQLLQATAEYEQVFEKMMEME